MTNEHDLRDFLLGRYGEEQAESIENRLLEDDDFFQTARSVEDDLFDAFVRGDLTEEERAAFLRRYAGRRDRIQFARALSKRRPNIVAFSPRRWIVWAAAAAIAIAVTQMLVHTPQAPSTRPQQTQVRPVLRSIAVTVAIGGSRSESKPTDVLVPAGADIVKLRVQLNPADRFDKYVMTLRSNSVGWRSGEVHAANEGGDLFVSADVPAKVLQPGSYEIAVSGNGDELGFATLEVRPAK